MFDLLCYLIACILFALGAFGVPLGRWNLIAAGLFFLTLPLLAGAFMDAGARV